MCVEFIFTIGGFDFVCKHHQKIKGHMSINSYSLSEAPEPARVEICKCYHSSNGWGQDILEGILELGVDIDDLSEMALDFFNETLGDSNETFIK